MQSHAPRYPNGCYGPRRPKLSVARQPVWVADALTIDGSLPLAYRRPDMAACTTHDTRRRTGVAQVAGTALLCVACATLLSPPQTARADAVGASHQSRVAVDTQRAATVDHIPTCVIGQPFFNVWPLACQ